MLNQALIFPGSMGVGNGAIARVRRRGKWLCSSKKRIELPRGTVGRETTAVFWGWGGGGTFYFLASPPLEGLVPPGAYT